MDSRGHIEGNIKYNYQFNWWKGPSFLDILIQIGPVLKNTNLNPDVGSFAYGKVTVCPLEYNIPAHI